HLELDLRRAGRLRDERVALARLEREAALQGLTRLEVAGDRAALLVHARRLAAREHRERSGRERGEVRIERLRRAAGRRLPALLSARDPRDRRQAARLRARLAARLSARLAARLRARLLLRVATRLLLRVAARLLLRVAARLLLRVGARLL